MDAFISNIQRFSVHDGPGIRTTIFFMGCPLRCKWCQNPEAIRPTIKPMHSQHVCIGCGSCLSLCQQQALQLNNGTVEIIRERCNDCLQCIDACPSEALRPSGRRYELNELLKEVMKDEAVFRRGGGITLSGGEPLLCIDFTEALLQLLRDREIHTAVETCGYPPWAHYQRVSDLIDFFLVDVKLISSEKHKHWTGVDNKGILSNIRRLSEAARPMVLRVPLIPDVNDDEQEFGAIVAFAKSLPHLLSIHILPFHQIGRDKYEQLGMAYELSQLKEENSKRVKACVDLAQKAGFKVSVGGSGVKEERP
ncbi:MAG: glycyl-radical enzyme activating protein [Desulfobacterales bacterium]|jgi:pyruvate formate lyase activating enzyme